jgi:cellulose synthase/poly-beta-1,6-N-acetylglucosamine synthase-like glycosyltransferase
MTLFLHILFWLPVVLLFHSYLLFPLWLEYLHRRSDRKAHPAQAGFTLSVSVIIPAYNEESVIEKKIRSIYEGDYPHELLEVLVMSDASTDRTDSIVGRLTEEYASLRFFRAAHRTGKPGILNRLVPEARGDLLLLTDANVLLAPDTIPLLVAHFADPSLGLADTRLISQGREQGIALQEKTYTGREVRIKFLEGSLWGIIMGPSGACYALRKELYPPVPGNYLVDDFYINMKVLEKGKKAILVPEARVYEDVTLRFKEAFRRKVRIAAGNFQNLRTFLPLYRNIFRPAGFCFWSHKGIRWFGPWLILGNLTAALLLAPHSLLYLSFLGIHLLTFLLILLDNILGIFGKQIVILRFVTHFYSMNLALATGFIKALKGIKTNVWEPTERNP